MTGEEPSRSRRNVSRVNYAEDPLDAIAAAPAPAPSSGHKRRKNDDTARTPADAFATSGAKPSPGAQSAAASADFPLNWQPKLPAAQLSSVVNLDGAKMTADALVLANRARLAPGDHVYILSEPPGEPYYIGRIMEFVKKNPAPENTDAVALVYNVRVNWLYRPKDVSRHQRDTRTLYVTMHSDECPLQSLRGRCHVEHLDHIHNLDEWRRRPDHFWFDKYYDRYIMKFFDMVPTENLQSLPKAAFNGIRSRYKYIIVEAGMGKDLCSSPESCEKCSQWCSTTDSVTCARCKKTYHMACVDPPMTKKPARGFAWSCAPCALEVERKMELAKGSELRSGKPKAPSEEPSEDEPSSTTASSSADLPADSPPPEGALTKYQKLELAFKNHAPLTALQQHQFQLWPFRYLGMHAKLEDALDADDRIHPRVVSRLGSKHQAVIPDWYSHPVVYYNPPVTDKRKQKKRKTNATAETNPDTPTGPDPLRPWIQERPAGYVERGVDDSTATLMWKNPPPEANVDIDAFLDQVKPIASNLNIRPDTPNFYDACLYEFMSNGYQVEPTLEQLKTLTRKTLKEPTFNSEEKKRFEEGVKLYGSELWPVYQHMGSKSKKHKPWEVVRYYYLWKKTPNGHAIWDNYEGRPKNRRMAKDASGIAEKIVDVGDESAYDNNKIAKRKVQLVCKFCKTQKSRVWKKAPGGAGELSSVPSLCIRCALLWRRYAVQWEDPEEVLKKANVRGSQRRRVDEELIADATAILAERDAIFSKAEKRPKNARDDSPEKSPTPLSTPTKTAAKSSSSKRRSASTKNSTSRESSSATPPPKESTTAGRRGRKAAVKVESIDNRALSEDAPLTPTEPRCDVCNTNSGSLLLSCYQCGTKVHPPCYGVSDEPVKHWFCDVCCNDQHPVVSTCYTCTLCGITGSSINGAMKRTYDGLWAHARCAIWGPEEIKFGNPARLQPVEGIRAAAEAFAKTVHRPCSICQQTVGYIRQCSFCDDQVHLGCAGSYLFGFTEDQLKSPDKNRQPAEKGADEQQKDSSENPGNGELVNSTETPAYAGEVINGKDEQLKEPSTRIKLLAVCSRHPEYSCRWRGGGFGTARRMFRLPTEEFSTGTPFITAYCEAHRRSPGLGVSGPAKYALQFSKDFEKSEEGTASTRYCMVVNGLPISKINITRCGCGRHESPYWWKLDNGELQCQFCHSKDEDDRVDKFQDVDWNASPRLPKTLASAFGRVNSSISQMAAVTEWRGQPNNQQGVV